MKNSLLLILLITATLLNADDLEQQKYLEDFCGRVNENIEKLKDFPRKKTHINKISFDKNSVDIYLKSNLEEIVLVDIKDEFEMMNKTLMKRKFCRDDYFKRMQEGLVINFNYYNQKEELITNFCLNEESCKEANSALSDSKYAD
ncbi:MAG: hypothetical protein A2513_06170 [Sulfurimonas sp. RIFOXYD12_FULL_33_39]|uniref:hypothetical protein n=1 Tax=unclassified Sulfurimonas TaxID=2623549 RepID=UPI0008BDF96D|nr:MULTISPECIES: hypothetical protein [unclassified Sulfurimonas]OHE07516.1 MAG: hypothetical protein A3G74_00645 [Sulfurimonas sp. RIFCSPLOWO2_12_FULL_34_6]OHE10441.1 MAG: hypothetical protein A2513_06170 [Sulfurimonas sp. RIFOXYD12_FULL_33_39]OHE14900.1 MAG: hypothetical protein A2530_00360 [Sulfurimonas sp. RIFOXYD2_FULL_34_21]DAB27400.1 MAG TPA: hypothetical protein CFH78_08095 [Sulfurimonas sp. UBA10385]